MDQKIVTMYINMGPPTGPPERRGYAIPTFLLIRNFDLTFLLLFPEKTIAESRAKTGAGQTVGATRCPGWSFTDDTAELAAGGRISTGRRWLLGCLENRNLGGQEVGISKIAATSTWRF